MLTHVRSFGSRIAPAALALFVAATSPVSAQDVAQLAPPRSFLVVGVPNFAELASAFERSSLGSLWEEPEVKRFVETLMKDQAEEFSAFMEDLNIQVRDLEPPTGQVGFALFLPENFAAVKDTQGSEPHSIAVANMGEHAEAWDDALERLIDHGLDEKRITLEEDSYAGVDIRTLTPVYVEVNIPEEDEEFETEEESGGLAGFLGGASEHPRRLHIARVGDTFVACTDIAALEAAIDELGGKPTDSVADEEAFRQAAGMRTEGEHAYAVLMPRAIFDNLPNDGEEDAMMHRLMEGMGVYGVKAVGIGLKLNTAEATAEMSMGLLVPERKGLFALLVPAEGGFEPPAFVPANAADVGSLHINFARIPELYRTIANTFPEEQKQMMLQGFEASANIIVPTLEAMGPAVHFLTTYTQPLSAESAHQVWAIELKDQATVSNTMTFLMSMAQGMVEPRDFEGNTIYGNDEVPVALGLGFNRAFIGSTQGVENAMRLAGSPDAAAGLTQEREFRDAAGHTAPGAIGYTWADMEQTLRFMYWSFENQDKIFEQQLEAFEFPEEERREMMAEFRENQPQWVNDLPPLDLILRYVGNSVSELHATPEGLRARTLLLKPSSR